MVWYGVVDVLHVFNTRGEEVLVHSLSGYHGGSRIVASDVEGESGKSTG